MPRHHQPPASRTGLASRLAACKMRSSCNNIHTCIHTLLCVCVCVCIWVRQNQWSVLGSRLTSSRCRRFVLPPRQTPRQIGIWFNFMQFKMLLFSSLCWILFLFLFLYPLPRRLKGIITLCQLKMSVTGRGRLRFDSICLSLCLSVRSSVCPSVNHIKPNCKRKLNTVQLILGKDNN